MRLATIDLGTNSVRFDVHFLNQDGTPKLLHREKLMIRLGQGVFLKGRMDKNAMQRALHAFQHFKRIADDLRVSKIVAFGTSTLREAHDGQRLIDLLRSETGIDVRIISGLEEAKLIAIGILNNERLKPGRYALVDIGGGSTEISIGLGKKILFAESFPLGTARLQQLFLKKSPPRDLSIRQLRGYIRNILSQKMIGENWPKVGRIIGSSGTVRALAKIANKKSKEIYYEELVDLVEDMSTMTTTKLLEIPGMEAKRVDMILAGSILMEEVMKAVGAKYAVPTEYSLRDGILSEEMNLARQRKSSLIELHWNDLYKKAIRFGADEAHLYHMVALAESLFDRLAKLHKLEPAWKIYLLSTVILRHTGQVVGITNYEKHSYYIVKNSDFPAMQGWEHEFIAQLCLHHGSGKLSSKDLDFVEKDKKRKTAFIKLCALVRVLDGLDLGPKTTLKLARITVNRSSVKIAVSGKAAAGIETMLIERKKKLFEEVFSKYLEIERV